MKKLINELFILFIGNLFLALAVGLFLLPSNILSGGVAGIAVLLKPFIPINESTMVLILNVILLALGTIFLGKKFFVNTCLSSILYPVLLVVVQTVYEAPVVDQVLAAVYGGVLGGIGIGLVVKAGSSTGGMDIPPLLIHKFFGIDVAKGVMFTDAATVLFGLYIYGLEAVLIGLISVYMTSIAISKAMTYGTTKAKSVQIISNHYLEIQDAIHKVLDHGTTILEGMGGYTNQQRKVILVVIHNNEYAKLIEIINKYDEDAFVIVSDAAEVKGNGFGETSRI